MRLALAVPVVASVLLTACAGSGIAKSRLTPPAGTAQTRDAPAISARHPTAWTRDARTGISVSHPAAWRLRQFDESGSFTTALMFLSNRPVQAPCTTRHTTQGISTHCRGLPRSARMTNGGVIIAWLANGFPEPAGYDQLSHTAGRLTRIDGHRARIAATPATGTCKTDGGTMSVTATIAVDRTTNNITMSACLSHPSPVLRAQVLKSLRSVHT